MNKKEIEKLIYSGNDKDYSLGNGLYVRVRKSSKVWIYRGTLNGKPKVKTIGKFPDLSTDQARKSALEYRQDLKNLTNDDTVSAFLHKYYTEAVLGSKNKRGKPHKRPLMSKRYLDQIEKKLGSKKIDSVSRKELIAFIGDYSKRGARVADVLRSQLKSVFDYAVFHGVVKNNPMLEIDSRVTGYRPVSRERVLTDREIKLIFNSEHRNARLLRFLLLTGLRIGESQLGYKEGDFWLIDAKNTKNGKRHWVYLTDTAKAQLPLPWTSPTNIQAWLRRWLTNEGYKPEERFTPHDLRRTFATRLNNHNRNTDIAESIGDVPPYIVEKMLNHTLDGVMQVYNRAEYKEQRIQAHKLIEEILLNISGADDD